MPSAIIVDDREDNLYLLEAILNGNGFTCSAASNGKEALALARLQPPDIIISDILMPVMDGFALCRAWRGDPLLASIPFIFYTATYTSAKDRSLASDTGSDAYIIKPAEPEELMAKVNAVMASAKANASERPPQKDGSALLSAHNDALFRKLEAKMLELEVSNMSLARDIDERKKIEATLREREERYRLLAETMKDVVWVIDSETMRITYASPSSLALIGASASALTGMSLPEAIGENLGRDFESKVAGRIAIFKSSGKDESEVFIDELDARRRDGSEVCIESISWMTKDKSGRIELRGCSRDISLRKDYQNRLRHAEKMEAIGQLAGGVAHDFNNNLLGIVGFAEGLKAELAGTPLQAHAEAIVRIASRSAELTKKLLGFARKGKFNSRPVSLHRLIEDCVEILSSSIDKRISIELDLQAENDIVEGDAQLLQNALLNLAVNARDAMPSGGLLRFSTSNATDMVCIVVSDTGSGMDPATLNRLFEPFFTTKPMGKGTGLGLASVYGAVKSHSGTIDVASELGKGTAFTIKLRSLAVDDAVMASLARQPAIQSCETAKAARILYIDDDPLLRDVVSEMLRRLGHEPIVMPSAKEALRFYETAWKGIDLIILDMMMPDINGADAFVRLREINHSARVAIATGGGPDENIERLLNDGAAGFIQKPFDMGTLASCLDAVLAGRTWTGTPAQELPR